MSMPVSEFRCICKFQSLYYKTATVTAYLTHSLSVGNELCISVYGVSKGSCHSFTF